MRGAFLLILLLGPVHADTVRVVSLAPSLTEIIYAIGATNELVGRSSACKYPAAVTNVPIAGDFGVPALEALALCKPDIVVTVDLAEKNSVRAIERLGIRHVSIPCRSLDDIATAIRTLGMLLHHELAADKLAATYAVRLITLRAQKPKHRRRVFVEVWNDPLVTAGKRSFLNELLTLAGGDNIGSDVDRDFYQISPEAVLARDPEVVIVLNPSRREWKAKRVCRDLDRDLLSVPGPRVLEVVDSLKNCIGVEPASRPFVPEASTGGMPVQQQ
ncbi:MAG: Vitamin B12-binding protein [Verrucomicrobiae bacterium]|nr:Vitamin B12-binding protein [Verrucomicrobiae bacterium]